jgi:hypothetical protein
MSGGASRRGRSRGSAEEIPEVDFSRGIQPHRYARLRSGYRYVVHLKPALWREFGSAEAVEAALHALVQRRRRTRASRRAG